MLNGYDTTENRKSTALLVAGSWMVRSGMRRLVRSVTQCSEVLEASSAVEARSVAAANEPIALALIEINPRNANWLGDLKVLCDSIHPSAIAIFTARLKRSDFLQCIDFGVMGFVSRDAGRDDIVKALTRVLSGELHIQKRHLICREAGDLVPATVAPSTNGGGQQIVLTLRERQVLRLLAKGQTNSDIADGLGITQNTVRTYTSFLMKKLHLKDRTQVALRASDMIAAAKA